MADAACLSTLALRASIVSYSFLISVVCVAKMLLVICVDEDVAGEWVARRFSAHATLGLPFWEETSAVEVDGDGSVGNVLDPTGLYACLKSA